MSQFGDSLAAPPEYPADFVKRQQKLSANAPYQYVFGALLHKLRFRHKLPLPDNGLKDTLSDWRTQMSETV